LIVWSVVDFVVGT